ncbi:MAG TPA: antibiotic biosynthesis monooxygenase [Gammaproteobacteria bacterium]|nr:antibiotic biosynthesis monooxygenase [Gammaproteobacteria bacterium]
MKVLPVNEGAFTVLLSFDCRPAESERFALELAHFVEERMRFHPGFLSGTIYLSEDASKVFELFQWARAEDWHAYRASEDGRDAVRWLSGHRPGISFLETVRCVVPPAPGERTPPPA